MKLIWAQAKSEKNARFVVMGVPDEKGLLDFKGKGTKKAPDYIRKISCRFEKFIYEGKVSYAEGESTEINQKAVLDCGNIPQQRVAERVAGLVRKNKIPVILGGDHSITSEILKGIDRAARKDKSVSLLYLDAHPDFVCTIKHYHGSVICEALKYKSIDFKKSFEIGIRQPEKEELKNISKYEMKVIPAYIFAEKTIHSIVSAIRQKVGKNKIYLSIDMDVVDPAFAPGVSTPVPGGLTSNQLIALIRKLPLKQLIGMDIMEVNPKQDIHGVTGDLACRILAEVLRK